MSPVQLQFFEQYASHTPFPSSTSLGRVADQYLDKTNLELWQTYGLSYAGGLPSTSAHLRAGIFGFVAPSA
jgi:hypothetical protein